MMGDPSTRRLCACAFKLAATLLLCISIQGIAAGKNGDIDLLVTDMVMPGLSGPELAQRLQREHPGLGVLFMSGYSEHAATEMANADPSVRLLTKPFSRAAILRAVRETLQNQPRT